MSSTLPHATLLVHCPDRRGLVSTVTDFLSSNNGNIISMHQHIDPEKKLFFMRLQWWLEGFSIPKEKITDYFKVLIADKFDMAWQVHFSDEKPRMAIMVSRMSHCLQELLARYEAGNLQAEIPLIISNHPDLEYVADRFHIPYCHIPIGTDKATAEKAQLELLQKHKINLVVLARYMQVLSPEFLTAFAHPVINIHHSFLPAFPGARPYHHAYERGVKIIGATCHYVTPELDAGPIIEQDVARVNHSYTVDDLINKGQDLEKLVLSRGVHLHLTNRTLVYDNKVIVFEG